ncbi:MAG TPA: hypothetical protein VH257_12860, partial [Chloroflexota bacterium]|nr:hypothetical protein [Chloroflexota bacterium]
MTGTGTTSPTGTTSAATPAGLEWPASPWEASAPESYLLLHFQRRPEGKEALKLGLLELLARHRLRLVEVERQGLFGRRTKTSSLIWGTPPDGRPATLGTALAHLWDVYQEMRPRRESLWGSGPQGEQVDGVDVKDFARAVVKRFGSMDGYLQQALRPALQERGWVAPQRYRILGLFP